MEEKLSELTINKLVKGIIDGMRYIHSMNIVHRDLKSLNILLDDDNAVICDFGMSKILEQTNNMSTFNIGSIAYMAPEIMLNVRYNFKCDIFSFGVVLWEIMHGKIPYREERFTGINIINFVAHEKLRLPMDLTFNNEVSSIIRNCWSENPENRPNFNQLSEMWAKFQSGYC